MAATLLRELVYKDIARTSALPRLEKAKFTGDGPEVELLKSEEDIARAFMTETEAMRNDPLSKYIFDPPDTQKSWRHDVYMRVLRMREAALLKHRAQLDQVLQVYHGDAIAVFIPPADANGPPKPSGPWLIRFLSPLAILTSSPQQRRRIKEVESKLIAAENEHLGDKKDELFLLGLLVTHPAYQGRGYGSALVKALAWMADAAERPTWLISSNVINKEFYESFGYKSVADIVIGDEDPDYDDEPFVISLMIRQPEKVFPVDEK
ncbi:hypothetical protein FA95DRAFT_1558417 [Auriscalpium vulgare]|uniref:Uncharacterized protein n=1 Tax=Auriscalpium vulgare TaxID=40419 RepID=A0ACB8RVF1_9AGAM|nr:hypothetical protein FA95DRAFT_1558417 [Auriscalpium vulgare]